MISGLFGTCHYLATFHVSAGQAGSGWGSAGATSAAGTTSPATSYATLALLGLILLVGYAAACWIWPYAACRRCKGRGKFESPTGRAWRRCRRCKGGGERLRFGRLIFNYLYAKRKDAK